MSEAEVIPMHESTATRFLHETLMDGLATPTLGGAAHAPHANGMDRWDRVGGVGHVLQNLVSDSHCIFQEAPASLSGAGARSERPQAMLARGSRVTGSGGAFMSIPSETGIGIARPDLLTVIFTDIADFRSDRFL